jgi:hypothetical protein
MQSECTIFIVGFDMIKMMFQRLAQNLYRI